MAAAHQFRFDTVQMPLNVMDAHFRTFQPMSPEAVAALLARTAPAAASGHYELFKTSDRFDSTAHNPQWLG